MKGWKSILKTCAVLVAAVMATSPITVRADGAEEAIPAEAANRIAERGVWYKTPSYEYAYKFDNSSDVQEWKLGNLAVKFNEEIPSNISYYGTVPEGYKGVSAFVKYEWLYSTDEYWGDDIPGFYFSMDAENSKDWVRANNIDGQVDWDEEYVRKYNFTVDCDGTAYSGCWAAFAPEGGIGKIEMVIPQQYNGALTFTIKGVGLENGEQVANEASYITFYLQGGVLAAEQQPIAPVAEQQPVAPVVEQQPAAEQQPMMTERYGSIYVTKTGDNLMKIAKELYGNKDMWTSIYEMNKGIIKNPNVIFTNMQLVLP